jgi:hypothetical protein
MAPPALLTTANRMLFHCVSYKLMRLMLPWMFLLLLFTSFWLPWPWSIAALSAQGLFYGLAALDLAASGVFEAADFAGANRGQYAACLRLRRQDFLCLAAGDLETNRGEGGRQALIGLRWRVRLI